ncbi:MAG: hypothetical protein ACYC28_03630 [Longimicrobiales bacterium]
MKTIRNFGTLLLAAVAFAGCEDITNPVEEFGSLEDPYVRFETSSAIGTPGSTTRVIFQMPTRVEEDVTIQYTFGGDAVFGEDYVIVNAAGDSVTDLTAAGGTATIPFDPEQTTFGRDTIFIFVPFDATDGRTAEVQIASATVPSGQNIETGFIDAFNTFELNVEGFVDVPVGTYATVRAGDFGGGAGTVTITKPAAPVVIGGVPYDFVISDTQGDAGVFGIAVPWAFSVTSGGTVIAPRVDTEGLGATADVTGTFNFTTNVLNLALVLDCCGAVGAGWTLQATYQP